jgi:hypothetical protein
MAKGRNKQGREVKKKKKAKGSGAQPIGEVQFRHHAVVTSQPETPVKPPE